MIFYESTFYIVISQALARLKHENLQKAQEAESTKQRLQYAKNVGAIALLYPLLYLYFVLCELTVRSSRTLHYHHFLFMFMLFMKINVIPPECHFKLIFLL